MRPVRLQLWTQGWVLRSFLAGGWVRQAVHGCLLVEIYEFWCRPWGKQGLDLPRCCKICPALLKAQRSNSLMVLLKTFIEPFCYQWPSLTVQVTFLSLCTGYLVEIVFVFFLSSCSFYPQKDIGLSLIYVFWYNSLLFAVVGQFVSLINGL